MALRWRALGDIAIGRAWTSTTSLSTRPPNDRCPQRETAFPMWELSADALSSAMREQEHGEPEGLARQMSAPPPVTPRPPPLNSTDVLRISSPLAKGETPWPSLHSPSGCSCSHCSSAWSSHANRFELNRRGCCALPDRTANHG